VFPQKLRYYDLIHDMTSFSPERVSRPIMKLSVREPSSRSRKWLCCLSTVRFTSVPCQARNPSCDKNCIVPDRILGLNAAHGPRSLWMNAGQRYESWCLAGAGLETGSRTWRNNHGLTNAEEQAHTDGAAHMRVHGDGIASRPMMAGSVWLYRNVGRHYADMTPPSTWGDVLRNDYHDDDKEQERVWDDAVPARHGKSSMTITLLHT
jgi:hypothetical protein